MNYEVTDSIQGQNAKMAYERMADLQLTKFSRLFIFQMSNISVPTHEWNCVEQHQHYALVA
jgi:hypothetical protein